MQAMKKKIYGEAPRVDHQGNKNICVMSAASKAITAGLWYGKFTGSRFDVSQDLVLGFLLAMRDYKLTDCSPLDLNGKSLNLLNKVDNTWHEFQLDVTEMTKKDFLAGISDSTKEYLVANGTHMMYLKKVEKDGKMLWCMNSWGSHDEPEPKLKTQSVEDNDIFSIKLYKQSEADVLLAASVNDYTKLENRSLADLMKFVGFAKCNQLAKFQKLELSNDLTSLDPCGLSKLVSLATYVALKPDLILSREQWDELEEASKTKGWNGEVLLILIHTNLNSTSGQAIANMAKMTNRVFINTDLVLLDWQQLTAAISANEARCTEISCYSDDKPYRKEISKMNKKIGWAMTETKTGITLKRV